MDALWLFALLVFGIVALPGMDMAFVLSSTLADGRRGGFAALAGIVAGGIVHVAMGTLGIGLLLQAWPAAFNALLVTGALYVGWIGWNLWRQPGALGEVDAGASRPASRTFLRALATCLLNPKAYVFTVAVFPQFMRPENGPLLAQAIAMSAICAFAQVTVYGGVALGAAGLRQRLVHSASGQLAMGRGVALLLVATAAWALWHSWQRV
ncbi:LysE family translocator [Ramlibacter sp. XY19]|uniref:LysE family translocator n=1 Tax=Ramlibacter paludis TaxID=2908000 RepID=UPI0023DA50F4|nr:LysE family translocator [Ramlibacter paludis]MCG2594065.1 LysE family translocator [Ramlibacter paludis]